MVLPRRKSKVQLEKALTSLPSSTPSFWKLRLAVTAQLDHVSRRIASMYTQVYALAIIFHVIFCGMELHICTMSSFILQPKHVSMQRSMHTTCIKCHS